MNHKCYILYPCGKKFEIRIPIISLDDSGNKITILPGEKDYIIYAKKKFQINNLKIIEEEFGTTEPIEQELFISLVKKIRSIE